MKKTKNVFIYAAMLLFAFSLIIYPEKANAMPNTAMTLLPPLCYVEQMYGTNDKNTELTQDDITNDSVKYEVRFKIVEIIKDIWGKLFGN